MSLRLPGNLLACDSVKWLHVILVGYYGLLLYSCIHICIRYVNVRSTQTKILFFYILTCVFYVNVFYMLKNIGKMFCWGYKFFHYKFFKVYFQTLSLRNVFLYQLINPSFPFPLKDLEKWSRSEFAGYGETLLPFSNYWVCQGNASMWSLYSNWDLFIAQLLCCWFTSSSCSVFLFPILFFVLLDQPSA